MATVPHGADTSRRLELTRLKAPPSFTAGGDQLHTPCCSGPTRHQRRPDQRTGAQKSPPPADRSLILHSGTRKEVVGESHHQDVLRAVAGPLEPDGASPDRRLHLVRLIAEPDNSVDPEAIRVELDGELVGYIPAERTTQYHPFLEWAAAQGFAVLSRAHIIGGFRLVDGRTASLGIALNHSSPPTVQYDGPRPTIVDPTPEQWSWKDINVTGEQDHQEFLAARQFRMNVAELTIRDSRVMVSLEGREIGRLTQKMSERYGNALQREIELDGSATVFCKVSRGPNKLECTVKLPTGEQLAEWEMFLRWRNRSRG